MEAALLLARTRGWRNGTMGGGTPARLGSGPPGATLNRLCASRSLVGVRHVGVLADWGGALYKHGGAPRGARHWSSTCSTAACQKAAGPPTAVGTLTHVNWPISGSGNDRPQ
jgi:hypothetical protein